MHHPFGRSLLSVIIGAALAVGACSSAEEGESGWTFGPELGAGEESAAPSGEASGAPSAAPSGDASAAPSAAPSASGDGGDGGGPTMTDDSLGVDVAAQGFTEPTGIAFLGADESFVIEKSTGEVHRVQGGEPGEPVLDLAVNFFDERGLLGIALHPQFDDNGYVYLYWTSSGEGDGEGGLLGADTDEATAVPELGNRVDRFVWDGEALTFDREIVALRSNTLDTDTSDRVRGNHDAGPIVFGPDGMLYIVNGDQNLRGRLQNIQDGPEATDADLAGIVLRLNDDGSVPDDNPFAQAGAEAGGEVGENLAMIWAYGIRNSFGMAIHPDTGALWLTENGDDSWDEVNILPAGANSGWIQTMGPPERHEDYRRIEVESEDGLDNPDYPPDQLAETTDAAQEAMVELPGSQYVAPAFSWQYPPAVTSIAFTTGTELGESSTGTAWLGTVLTDSLLRYPLAADGSGFDFGDDQALADLVDDNESKGDLGESADYVAGTGFGVVTHIVTGPEGFLYVVSITNGAVYRIGPADQVGGGGEGEGGGGEAAASPTPGLSPAPGTPLPGEAVQITIGTDTGSQLLFDPTTASAPAGGEVQLTFENRSPIPHNLSFAPPINTSTNTIVDGGASETIGFTAPNEAGEYEFVCTLHPGMEGVLTVEAAG
jgi:glucose/arabinose dehydrogenase/plastocyanin